MFRDLSLIRQSSRGRGFVEQGDQGVSCIGRGRSGTEDDLGSMDFPSVERLICIVIRTQRGTFKSDAFNVVTGIGQNLSPHRDVGIRFRVAAHRTRGYRLRRRQALLYCARGLSRRARS